MWVGGYWRIKRSSVETNMNKIIGVAGEEIRIGDLVVFHEDGRLYKIKLDETGNPDNEEQECTSSTTTPSCWP